MEIGLFDINPECQLCSDLSRDLWIIILAHGMISDAANNKLLQHKSRKRDQSHDVMQKAYWPNRLTDYSKAIDYFFALVPIFQKENHNNRGLTELVPHATRSCLLFHSNWIGHLFPFVKGCLKSWVELMTWSWRGNALFGAGLTKTNRFESNFVGGRKKSLDSDEFHQVLINQ